ncbi:hypothetical protein SLEP1_g37557 [Rubroshorea leprosula]|uniref:Protein-tyrosine-phosphatase MKP1 n=1 Tax=Rubroshorea leprosula TaxID=152421 RepID=A0AAV5KVF1_9ROSI|nr:hypothetical protein SLEP1_g37557 [Rubroshorea leprosula]
MVGKEDASSNPWAGGQISGSRKMFLRSASWSSRRTASQASESEEGDLADPHGSNGNNDGQSRRCPPPPPLTPRSQQNCKARSCLPPLQPLSIARRSLDEWPKASSDDLGEWPQPPTPSGNKSGERLKLDLSSIQRNPDKNGGLVKRDKIAFFDKECSKVAEHIYLGGDAVARDRDILKKNGITHVLNCVGFLCSEYFKDDFVYRTLWLQDNPSEDITSILYDVFDYFEDVREQHGRVFVHCCQGVSRSTSLVIAYLMWREGQSFDDAFQYVKAARGIADPNMGFACQLLQCQKRVHAVPLSPSSLLRMYKLAPHSPYDPLHLVPKMLNDPSPFALDSRGAFIIQIPSAMYIWIGKNCDAIMERDARGSVCQIFRYEKVRGPIVMIKEGEEPSHFWDAFSNFLPLMDKSGRVEFGESTIKISPGQRKVDAYNVDFEIFQKAIKGGFVPSLASSENEYETHLPARESSWSALRRKFASGVMKEFVILPKLSLPRVYSESMMVVHSSSPSSSLSSSSSPYLSPDSISSDSSTGSRYSESSVDSPSAASCPLPVSSALSNISNLTLCSSKMTEPQTNGPEIVGKTCNLQPSPRSAASAFKKASVSLAERRGSLSKSLKLPAMTDNIRVNPPSFHVSQEDGIGINGISYSSYGSDIEIVFDSKCGVRQGEGDLAPKLKISPGGVANIDLCDKEAVFADSSGPPCRNYALGDGFGSTALKGLEESGSSHPNVMQPLVYRLPHLERISRLSMSDLDSKSAFAIFIPSTGLGKSEVRNLYFWVGRSFSCDKSWIQLNNSGELGDKKEIEWNQVGSNVLAHLGLPKDTPIKIVKEDEDRWGFLHHLVQCSTTTI